MIDVERFKAAMRRLAAGVSVITTAHEGERYGILVTSVISLSASPPSVLVSVNQQSSLHAPLLSSGRFGVSILRSSQNDVATRFITSKGRDGRFGEGWTEFTSGTPMLENALTCLDCEIADRHSVLSHTLFIGRIMETKEWNDNIEPLVYLDGKLSGHSNQLRAAS